jgi:hypothetical protein
VAALESKIIRLGEDHLNTREKMKKDFELEQSKEKLIYETEINHRVDKIQNDLQ